MSSHKPENIRVEDYLTTIYRLEEALDEARITDISRELKVSPATVSKIIGKLEERNLVIRVKYRGVKLTEKGRSLAERIIRKHRIAEVFLLKILGFDEVESHQYAHYLEHLPDIIVERMYESVGKPPLCPHGNKIPGTTSTMPKLIKLTETQPHQVCIVKRIAGEFADVLEYVHGIGIKVGASISVLKHTDERIIVKLQNNSESEIPFYIARFIYVEC
ncbi:MAG: metal-dependent transcriptional regulator [Desulfurococcaceae archaeon]